MDTSAYVRDMAILVGLRSGRQAAAAREVLQKRLSGGALLRAFQDYMYNTYGVG